jgi:hypothetical protein
MLVGSIGWSRKVGDKVAKGQELGWFQVRHACSTFVHFCHPADGSRCAITTHASCCSKKARRDPDDVIIQRTHRTHLFHTPRRLKSSAGSAQYRRPPIPFQTSIAERGRSQTIISDLQQYGGSTNIVIFPSAAGIQFDHDLQETSAKGMETLVRVGMEIGQSDASTSTDAGAGKTVA